MTSMFSELFEGVDTYPGSKQRRDGTVSRAPQPDDVNPLDGIKPYLTSDDGKEYYKIGQLAAILGRKSGTVRKWEHDGHLPSATYQTNANENRDERARRRLYSREQVEGIWEIAKDEGLLNDSRVYIGRTKFTQRVTKLFQSLSESR